MSKQFSQLREELTGSGQNGELVYLSEASLGRIYQHTKQRNVGMITAHRAEHTAEDNVARNRSLESDIRSHGYGFHHVDGAYTENKGTPEEKLVKERSYLVVGKKGEDHGELKGFLKKHGEKYDQDSVLHKAHNEKDAKLVGTTHREGAYVPHGHEQSVGEYHPGRAPEFHSILRNKKTFAFEQAGITENIGSGLFGAWVKAAVQANK